MIRRLKLWEKWNNFSILLFQIHSFQFPWIIGCCPLHSPLPILSRGPVCWLLLLAKVRSKTYSLVHAVCSGVLRQTVSVIYIYINIYMYIIHIQCTTLTILHASWDYEQMGEWNNGVGAFDQCTQFTWLKHSWNSELNYEQWVNASKPCTYVLYIYVNSIINPLE